MNNLSHLLLQHIVSFIDSNIDRVCLSLVSKRLFNEKDRYLSLNPSQLTYSYDYYDSCNINLDSYRSLIIKTLDQYEFRTMVYIDIDDNEILFQHNHNIIKRIFNRPHKIKNIRTIRFSENFVNNHILKGFIPDGVEEVRIESNIDIIPGAIPDSVKLIQLIEPFGSELLPNTLPIGLKSIDMGIFNMPLAVGTFPDGLETLIFGPEFNQSIHQRVLPKGLKHLVFGEDFNRQLKPGVLPLGLETLVLGDSFNQPILPGLLPPHLQELEFGIEFDQNIAVGILPSTLHTLKLGNFNHEIIIGTLPTSLTTLCLGTSFNLPIPPNALPNGLKHLEFSPDRLSPYNQPLPPLPSTLTHLILNDDFNQSLVGVLPKGLKHLALGTEYVQTHSFEQLGLEELEYIELSSDIRSRIYPTGKFPASVKTINTGYTMNFEFTSWMVPETVTHIIFGESFDQPLKAGCFPSNIKSIIFGADYNQDIDIGVFNHGLESITFGRHFNSHIAKGAIPETVTTLDFTGRFNKPLKEVIPPSCTEISLSKVYNHLISEADIAPIRHLKLGRGADTSAILPARTNLEKISAINGDTLSIRRISDDRLLVMRNNMQGGIILEKHLAKFVNLFNGFHCDNFENLTQEFTSSSDDDYDLDELDSMDDDEDEDDEEDDSEEDDDEDDSDDYDDDSEDYGDDGWHPYFGSSDDSNIYYSDSDSLM